MIFNDIIETNKNVLLSVIVVFLIISYIIFKVKNVYYPKLKIKNNKQISFDMVKYLDKYFIKNIYITILCCLIYITISFYLPIALRYFINTIREKNELQFPIVVEYLPNIKDILTEFAPSWFYIFGIIISIKIFLNIAFFDEILKMHLYLLNTTIYNKIIFSNFVKPQLITFWGKFYLFFYNITHLQLLSLDDDAESLDFFDQNDIYETLWIQKLSFFCISQARKYTIALWVFILLKNIFKCLYRHFHFDGIIKYIPYSIFILCLFFDLFYGKIYYTYHSFLPLYSFNCYLNCMNFFYTKSFLKDRDIAEYFYISNYKNNRQFIKTDFANFMTNFLEKDNDNFMYLYFSDTSLATYIYNNFKITQSNAEKKTNRLVNSFYKRFILVFSFSIILYNLIKQQDIYFILVTNLNLIFSLKYVLIINYFCLVLLQFAIYTTKTPEGRDFTVYIFKKYYNILFWILASMEIFLIYLILKNNKIYPLDDVLWCYLGIKIFMVMTEDMKAWFLEYYINACENQLSHHNIRKIRSFIEDLELKEYLLKPPTLRLIRNRIDFVFDVYLTFLKESLDAEIKEMEAKLQPLKKYLFIKDIMDHISTIISYVGIYQFIFKYGKIAHKTYQITSNPQSKGALTIFWEVIKFITSLWKP